jgi:hypothetical protein
MELKIWKWKLSIKISKIKKIRSKRKAMEKIHLKKAEQLQLLALLQQENKKVTENSSMILNVGLTLIVITLSIILLLQGAIGPLANLTTMITSNTMSKNAVSSAASDTIPSNSLSNNTMTANAVLPAVRLQVENVIVTFQAVFFVAYIAIPVIWMLTQILAGIYRKRVNELRQYILDTYEIDDDVQKIIIHVMKD